MDQDFKRYLEDEIYKIKKGAKYIKGPHSSYESVDIAVKNNIDDILQAIRNIEYRIGLESRNKS